MDLKDSMRTQSGTDLFLNLINLFDMSNTYMRLINKMLHRNLKNELSKEETLLMLAEINNIISLEAFWKGIRAYVLLEHENFIKLVLMAYIESGFKYIKDITSAILKTFLFETLAALRQINAGIEKADSVINHYYDHVANLIASAPIAGIDELRHIPNIEEDIRSEILNVFEEHRDNQLPLDNLEEKFSEENLEILTENFCSVREIYATDVVLNAFRGFTQKILTESKDQLLNARDAEQQKSELLKLKEKYEMKAENIKNGIHSGNEINEDMLDGFKKDDDELGRIKNLNDKIDNILKNADIPDKNMPDAPDEGYRKYIKPA